MNLFGWNPEKWMDGQHCLAGDSIIELMIASGSIVTAMYFVFCIVCVLLATRPSWFQDKFFFFSLSVVFFFCGTIHSVHVWGKIWPQLYMISIIYPVLDIAMFILLIASIRFYKKALSIGDPIDMQRKLEELQSKL